MVQGRQLTPEQVEAVGDRRAKAQHDSGDRQAAAVVDLHAMTPDVLVLQQVGHPPRVQRVLPIRVAIGGGKDAEGLRPQRHRRAIGVGVVEAQPAAQHVPVGLHLGQGARQAGVAGVAPGELGLAVPHDAQRARLDDALLEVPALGGAQEAGLVVVGVCGQQRIARRQVEHRLVPLQLLVPEDAEGGVARAVSLDHLGRTLPEHHALLLDAVALGHERAIGTRRVVMLPEPRVDREEMVVQPVDGEAHVRHGPLDLQDALRVGRIELDPAFLRLDGRLQCLLHHHASQLDAVDGRLSRVGTRRDRRRRRGQHVATRRNPCDDRVRNTLLRRLLGGLDGILHEFLEFGDNLVHRLHAGQNLVLHRDLEVRVVLLPHQCQQRLELGCCNRDFLAGPLRIPDRRGQPPMGRDHVRDRLLQLAGRRAPSRPGLGLHEEPMRVHREVHQLIGLVPHVLAVRPPVVADHLSHPILRLHLARLKVPLGPQDEVALDADLDFQRRIQLEPSTERALDRVHVRIMHEVRPRIPLRPCLARPDVIRVRRAVELDQGILICGLLLHHRSPQLVQGILLRTHELGDVLRVVEGCHRVVQGHLGALVDLLEVGPVLRPDDHSGVQVKGDATLRDAHWAVAALGPIDRCLDGRADARQFLEFRNGRAIHALDALVLGVRIDGRQHGVAHHPMHVAALPRSRGPVVQAPMPRHASGAFRRRIGRLGIRAGRAKLLPGVHLGPVGLAPCQVHHLLPGPRQGHGAGGKLSLVLVIHRDGLAQDVHGLDAWHPVEAGVHEQRVVSLDRREVMPIGVAMALRVHQRGVLGVDDAVGVLAGVLLDVVVQRIDHLARADAARVIPHEPVVHGGRADAGHQEVVAPAQQGQLLVREVGHLPLEGEQRRGHVAVARVLRADANRRVGSVRPGLVAQREVQVMEVPGRQKQGVVGGPVVEARLDAQHPPAAQHGLVDLDEAVVVDRVHVQGHVALPTPPRLRQQAHVGVDRVVEEVGQPLAKRVDARQDALDPALGQLG